MIFQRFDDRYAVRLESGDSLHESLVQLAESESITFASFSGLGAVSSITLGYLNREIKSYETRDFDEQLELLSLIGNIAIRDGRPFVHVHATVSRRDLSVLGGHVMAAVTWPTIEISLRREAAQIERLPDDESGLALLDLPERL